MQVSHVNKDIVEQSRYSLVNHAIPFIAKSFYLEVAKR